MNYSMYNLEIDDSGRRLKYILDEFYELIFRLNYFPFKMTNC